MKKDRKVAIAAFVAVLLSVVSVPVAGMETTDSETTGKWMESFVAATNYAVQTSTPLVLFWANERCGECARLEKGVSFDAFKSWQAGSPYAYCFVLGEGGKDVGVNEGSGANEFARSQAGTITDKKKWISKFPYVCLYWPKRDGTFVAKNFVGRSGSMLVDKSPEMYKHDEASDEYAELLADELRRSIELYFKDYIPVPSYAGGDIAFTANYPCARLEAEKGVTEYVDVPLKRASGTYGFVGTNEVLVKCSGAVITSEKVVWGKTELSRSIRVTIPDEVSVGDTIDVTLLDPSDAVRGSAVVNVVGPVPNSARNPFFIGEKTADELRYGEWTMDLEVAMEKYGKEPDSKILVLAGGALWCPDCLMTDIYLLDTHEFAEWSETNKVILVNVDIPNLPNSTNSPSLLNMVVSRSSDGYVTARGTRDPVESDRYQSGAGYLSRHMVPEKKAQEVLTRNATILGSNWLAGGWNNPDRANQSRTGVPVFFTLTRDGDVAGCFDAFASTAPRAFNAAYLKRFNELLAMAEDRGDLLNSSWRTTEDEYDGVSSGVTSTLSAVDSIDTYRLSPISADAALQSVSVKGENADVNVTVSLIVVIDGKAKTLATSSGSLADGVSVEGCIDPKADYYLQISGAASGTLAASSVSETTVSYSVSGERSQIENPFENEYTVLPVSTVLPLYSPDGKELAGTLTFSQKKSRSVTAKFSNGKKTLASFSGKWDKDKIAVDGTATLVLRKKTYTLSLTLHSDGFIEAVVDDGTSEFSSGECGLAATYAEFAGSYVVALPPYASEGSDALPLGCSYMTLKMTSSSAKKKGRFSYSVKLSDGKSLSGSSNVTWLDADFGLLPVLKQSSSYRFSAVFKIRRNAASAPSPRAVVLADGVAARLEYDKKGFEYEILHSAYGSYYDKKGLFPEMADLAEETGELMITAETSSVASPTYGDVVSVPIDGCVVDVCEKKISLANKVKGASIRVTRSSGMFTGSTKVNFMEKSNVSGKIRGIILPGWFSDCACGEDDDTLIPRVDIPFGIGYCVFSDKVNRKTVKRSFSIYIRSVE